MDTKRKGIEDGSISVCICVCAGARVCNICVIIVLVIPQLLETDNRGISRTNTHCVVYLDCGITAQSLCFDEDEEGQLAQG